MSGQVDLVYIAIMSSALFAGGLARRLTRDAGSATLNRAQRVVLALSAIVGGTLAAKLPYVLSDPDGAISGLAWLSDGRTLTWGLVGGYFGVELAKPFLGVKGKTGDGFAMPVAVSVGVGRLGCLWAGCCFGAPTELPWGMDFGDGVHRHPNQLYEAAFHFAAAGLLWLAHRRGWQPNQRIKLYVIGYMTFRFFAEWWRPEPIVGFGLTFYQWSALAFAALFVGLYAWDARKLTRAAAPRGTAPSPGP